MYIHYTYIFYSHFVYALFMFIVNVHVLFSLLVLNKNVKTNGHDYFKLPTVNLEFTIWNVKYIM